MDRRRVLPAGAVAALAVPDEFLREQEIPLRVEVIAGAGHLFRPPEWAEIFARSSAFHGGDIGRLDRENS